MLIDTHAHLTMPELSGELPDVLQRAADAGVRAIVCAGFDLPSSREAADLAARHPQLFATAGIHPNEAAELPAGWLQQVRSICGQPRVVAIGEIGLDYYRDRVRPEQQQTVLKAQLELAGELGLPVVIHNRQADERLVEILQEWDQHLPDSHPRGVMHCFSGDVAMMQTCCAAGFYISFAGPITYKNAGQLAGVVAATPADRLLLETDSPYLSPHPHRGKRNEPAMVRLVAERAAQLRGETPEETIQIAGRNAARLFGLEIPPASHMRD